jgi:hypothetical protein
MSRSRHPKCPRGRKRCGICSGSKQAGRRRREKVGGIEDVRQVGSSKDPDWYGCGPCESNAAKHNHGSLPGEKGLR